MIDVAHLPAVNATLNAMSAILLAGGYICIRNKNQRAHARFMLAAVMVSLLFLVSYLYYHAHVRAVTHFTGTGFIRPVYFAILTSHTLLAMVTAFWLVPVTLTRALRARFDRHRLIARWTLPIWFYVSVTGVLIYFMLYHWYAHA